MSYTDILREVVQAHNCIAGIPVSGDNAILMANALTVLRGLVSELQKEDSGLSGSTGKPCE